MKLNLEYVPHKDYSSHWLHLVGSDFFPEKKKKVIKRLFKKWKETPANSKFKSQFIGVAADGLLSLARQFEISPLLINRMVRARSNVRQICRMEKEQPSVARKEYFPSIKKAHYKELKDSTTVLLLIVLEQICHDENLGERFKKW